MNTPPFYIGQRIVAIVDHPQNVFKKGQEFIVKNILPAKCNCDHWLVDIGRRDFRFKTQSCAICDFTYVGTNDDIYFNHNRFAPIIEAFKSMEYTRVIEKELVSLN